MNAGVILAAAVACIAASVACAATKRRRLSLLLAWTVDALAAIGLLVVFNS